MLHTSVAHCLQHSQTAADVQLPLAASQCCVASGGLFTASQKSVVVTAASGKVPNAARRVPFHQHVLDVVVSTCVSMTVVCVLFTQYCNGGDLADYLQGKQS